MRFSLTRLAGLVAKEFIQLGRDRLTAAMLIGIPLVQLALFGYAINLDPKQLPTAAVIADEGPFTRSYLAALGNTGYFRFTHVMKDGDAVKHLLDAGQINFAIQIPEDFNRALARGERPRILIQADATDPIVTARAVAAAEQASRTAFNDLLRGPLARLEPRAGPVDVAVQPLYNPENITQYNTVPGLLGIILTLTLIMVTSISLAREREKGTMENLFAMPLLPVEVMAGKIIPFILGAYIQATIVLLASKYVFMVPIRGSLTLLSLALLLYITANLSIGFTISTFARNQLQAVQMSIFFFLPSVLLSGFVFPFRGMPEWAQWIGEALPITYFIRIVRGIMLKDASWAEIWPHVWPMLIILMIVAAIALRRYRATLD